MLDYLDQHYLTLDRLSIREAAKHCYTSPPSIVRLAKKLNLSGYNELIYKIKESHLPSPESNELLPTEEETQHFCDLMNQNKGNLITVLGIGFSAHISSYISEVLNFHSIPAITTAHTQLLNSPNNQKILFIIVSHSGEEELLHQTITLARKENNSVISFLGSRHSKLSSHSDLVLSTDSYSPFSTSVARPQLFFGRTLILFESLICAYINSENKK